MLFYFKLRYLFQHDFGHFYDLFQHNLGYSILRQEHRHELRQAHFAPVFADVSVNQFYGKFRFVFLDELVHRCGAPVFGLDFDGEDFAGMLQNEFNFLRVLTVPIIVERQAAFVQDIENQILVDASLCMPLQFLPQQGFLRFCSEKTRGKPNISHIDLEVFGLLVGAEWHFGQTHIVD